MRREEAEVAIAERVAVTRADIVAAKTHLLSLGAAIIDIEAEAEKWSKVVSPGTPRILSLRVDDDPNEAIRQIARVLSARMALCAAAWELVHGGVTLQVGQARELKIRWDETDGHGSSGLRWPELFMVYPERIRRPIWMQEPSELFDADLYLERLKPAHLHPNVEKALRMALECFQRELFIPCVAMLGAASEGAWIKVGKALAKRFSGESFFDKLAAKLDDQQMSTRAKIARVCDGYDKPESRPLYAVCGIKNTRLQEVRQWSDQVREARNVLHWEAPPSVPNTYEKVACLLMAAVSVLNDLHAVRDACR